MADYIEYEQIPVNKHKNLLIIGKADTKYSEFEISYEDDLDEVKKNYGEDSQLTKAFELAQKLRVPFIFLLNCQNHYDLFDLIDIIDQNDFAYIAPVNIKLSDMTYLPDNSAYKTTYISYVMHNLNRRSESVFIMTDDHASLYEDIDSFINRMNEVEQQFLNTTYSDVNKENIIFVANNLEDTEFANIYAAAALTNTSIEIYPQVSFPPPVFRIDKFDNVGSWAYFVNHYLSQPTVENFLNELPTGNPLKIVTISRLVKMIKRDMDLYEFLGRHYSEYQRVLIYKKLEAYLKSLIGNGLDDYEIISVTAVKNTKTATVTVYNFFSILPVNCLESIQVKIGVEVGI